MSSIVRPIDNFGRVVLPRDLRESLGITEKSSLEITAENGGIMLRLFPSNPAEAEVQRGTP